MTLATVLMSGVSVHAFERSSKQQVAQSNEEDNSEAGGAPAQGERARDPGEAREPRGGGGQDRGGDGPERAKGEDGDRPARAKREGKKGDEQPRELPTRRDRDPDPAPRKSEKSSPEQRVEEPPQPKAEDTDPPPAKKSPPATEVPASAQPPPPKVTEPAEATPNDEKPEPRGEPRAKKSEQPAVPDAGKAPAVPAPAPENPNATEQKEGADAPLRPDRKAVEPAAPEVAPSGVKDLKELKANRKERKEDGGKRVVIEEPDKRVIVKEGDKTIIRADETERFRRLGGNSRREKRNGLDISINIRPGGIEIFTEMDERGRPLRRYRRDRGGREVVLFDNRDYYRRHGDGSFIDAIVDLPPPRVTIPMGAYIVDYEEASDMDVYDALSAPPIERMERVYSLEEIRRSPTLRDRMRRIDLDVINFNFGAWDVDPAQYPALERVANAMKRVIERNPNEMFLIEGHTDAVGSDDDNLSLSDRRAETVAIILTEEFGVPPENIATQGYGEQYLKINTQEADRQNRRVAVRRITPLMSQAD
jgi:outer membrane protein OmpA-like peptidoglycan-associated protein